MHQMKNQIRADLPPAPARIRALPVDDRGYPVPWFVAWIDGKPEFRVADSAKLATAIRSNKCWVCGEPLGRYLAFVIGPMCTVNRISAEPPSHFECAKYSVQACPFLTKPEMVRRENDKPENTTSAGYMIADNPGVNLIWVARDYELVIANGFLFRLGDPTEVTAWRRGEKCPAVVLADIFKNRLPLLRSKAEIEGERAVAQFEKQEREARKLLGI